MLSKIATSAVSRAPADAGLTAFRVAVEQAKVFEKTLEEVSDRQEKETEFLVRKAEEQRQKVRENLAQVRGGLDIVVENDNSQSSQAAPEAEPASKGQEVDIEV